MTQAVELIAPFIPLPWQVAPLRDKSRILLLTGSAGGGKSRTAAEKIHACCLHYPGAVAIGLRKRREYASKSVVYALKAAQGDDKQVEYNKGDMTFHYANGSRIFIAGMGNEDQRQALRSINGDGSADFIWAEEANALRVDDHNELKARLRGKVTNWREIIYSTNPDTPSHWIKKLLMDGGEAKVYFSRASDNPHNPPDYLDILASLSGVLGQRLNEGKWVQAEGAVYDNFRDELHVIDRFPIPAEWRRIRVADFGYVNPFVCLWIALDRDGRMYIYREIYHTRRLVEQHARDIVRLSAGERIEATIADHDAEDRATLAAHGVPTLPADKAISPGLQAVRRRLDVAGDGKPRLYIFRDALVELDTSLPDSVPHSTLDEFPAYSWPKGADGRPIREVPLDMFNHGCLVGDTVIGTPFGNKALRDVRAGDYVAGRDGWVRVLDSALTQPAADIYCVVLANGAVLYGTRDHPIYTENRGFICTDALRYGDIAWYNYPRKRGIPCYPNHTWKASLRSSFTRDLSSVDTLHRREPAMSGTIAPHLRTKSAASIFCTAKSTRTILGKFRQDTRYTTKTETDSTTRWKTLSAYPEPIMRSFTSHSPGKTLSDAAQNGSSKRRRKKQRNGTDLTLVASGTVSTGAKYKQIENPYSTPASSAALHTRPRSPATSSIAATNASLQRVGQVASTTRIEFAPNAASCFPSISTASKGTALAPVVAVFATRERRPVYNLTVEGGEYYANGVLVHNCDALRYGVMYFDGPMFSMRRRSREY